VRYETAVPIGRGAMSEVLKAWDPHFQREAALELLRSDDPEQNARLLREARLQAQVRHLNVAEVYEVGDSDGRAFIAMQLVDGVPLVAGSCTRRSSGSARQASS
jgi:eukaryotic-like serine/threonine-protein kinase